MGDQAAESKGAASRSESTDGAPSSGGGRWTRFVPWLKVVVGVVLITVVAREIDTSLFASVSERWGDFLLYMGIAAALYFVAFSATVLRWYLLLAGFGVPVPLVETYRLGWIGLLFSQVIPGATGGDLVKAYYVCRERPEGRVAAITSVALDRVLGLVGLMTIGAVAFALNWEEVQANDLLRRLLWVLTGAGTAFVLGGALVAWEGFWKHPFLQAVHRRLPGRNLLSRLAEALVTLKRHPRVIAAAFLISVFNHFTMITLHVFLARALDGEFSPLSPFYFLIPVGLIANGLPLTPGGLGVGEAAYRELFSASGLQHGAELALLMRFTTLFWAVLGFYPYWRGKKELREAVLAAEESVKESVPAEPETSTDGSVATR